MTGSPRAVAGGDRRWVAPAKLTVSLRVTGVRPDGYHELDAEMVALSLADELVFDPQGSGVSVVADEGVRAEQLPGPGRNLVEAALAACGRQAGVQLTKRIPHGGGLGGGSADAAAVLRWAGVDDAALAARLGSDVPFCLIGGRARVEGVGEMVTPLPFVERHYLLVLPPFGVDTARVYRAWDDDPVQEGPNALTAAALAVEPRLAVWRDALGELSGVEPTLAGSGSTWFVAADAPGAPERLSRAARGDELRIGEHRARLVRVRTVPPGWEGD